MKRNSFKSLAMAAIALVCIAAPVASSAQRYPWDRGQNRGNQGYNNRNDLRDLVNQTERESNEFRSYFEHNFRSSGHGKRDDGYGDHAEHQGRNGQMTLRDAIQNLDEDMERLRGEFNSHGRSRRASELMSEVVDHARDVDQRVRRVSDWYDYNGDGNYNNSRPWRYDRSDLSSRWNELQRDINQLARSFNGRGR